MVLDNTCNVLFEIVFPLFLDKGFTIFWREDKVDVALGVGVCHNFSFIFRCAAPQFCIIFERLQILAPRCGFRYKLVSRAAEQQNICS